MTHANIFRVVGIVLVGLLSGCAGVPKANGMTPTATMAQENRGNIVVMSTGGAEAASFTRFSDEAFAQAIGDSFERAGLFTLVSDDRANFQLHAYVSEITQAALGFSMRVTMEVSYQLTRGDDPVWKGSIRSEYVAPANEALVGAVRIRKATEGAARENIEQLTTKIAAKKR